MKDKHEKDGQPHVTQLLFIPSNSTLVPPVPSSCLLSNFPKIFSAYLLLLYFRGSQVLILEGYLCNSSLEQQDRKQMWKNLQMKGTFFSKL